MGCGIHAFCEVKDGSGVWQIAQPTYQMKIYRAFSCLANVRDGYAFAGPNTAGNFVPIYPPRGLPDDVSQRVKEEARSGYEGHYHSWLLLQELLDYDWEQPTTRYGVVSETQYREYKATQTPPRSCYAYVFDSSARCVSHAEMDRVIAGEREENVDSYILLTWQITYRQAVGEGFFDTLEGLKELGKPENVRLVFWFDH